jgi:hypothetical protein
VKRRNRKAVLFVVWLSPLSQDRTRPSPRLKKKSQKGVALLYFSHRNFSVDDLIYAVKSILLNKKRRD